MPTLDYETPEPDTAPKSYFWRAYFISAMASGAVLGLFASACFRPEYLALPFAIAVAGMAVALIFLLPLYGSLGPERATTKLGVAFGILASLYPYIFVFGL